MINEQYQVIIIIITMINEQCQVIIIIITVINVGAVGVSVGCWKAALTPDFITSSQNPTLRV